MDVPDQDAKPRPAPFVLPLLSLPNKLALQPGKEADGGIMFG